MERELYATFLYDNIKEMPIFVIRIYENLVTENRQFSAFYKHYILIYCEEGSFDLIINNTSSSISSGITGLLRKPGEVVIIPKRCPYRVFVIEFAGSNVNTILDFLNLQDLEPFYAAKDSVDYFFNEIYNYVKNVDNFQAMISLLAFLKHVRGGALEPKKHRLANVKNYIHEHYCECINIETLAEINNSSVSYLHRAFKKEYNLTPLEYIIRLRISNAKKLLEWSTKTIAEVANECGFSTLEYFCYVFKKNEKCTPSEYRHSWRHVSSD